MHFLNISFFISPSLPSRCSLPTCQQRKAHKKFRTRIKCNRILFSLQYIQRVENNAHFHVAQNIFCNYTSVLYIFMCRSYGSLCWRFVFCSGRSACIVYSKATLDLLRPPQPRKARVVFTCVLRHPSPTSPATTPRAWSSVSGRTHPLYPLTTFLPLSVTHHCMERSEEGASIFYAHFNSSSRGLFNVDSPLFRRYC